MSNTATKSTAEARFYFKESDAEILKLLADYRFLQPSDIRRLTGRNLISLRRRLRQLLQRGYVERLTLPLERLAPVASPPDEFVYHLAGRGVQRAREYGFVDESYRPPRGKSTMGVPHDLLVTKFHLAIQLAIRDRPLELVAWEQRRSQLLDWVEDGSRRLSVNPDAYFGLKDRERPEGQNTYYFFLEIERTGENDFHHQQSNFLRKCIAYLQFHRQGRHTARYGISNFRVVTLTPTKQRAVNLCHKLRKAGLAFKRFWFTDLSPVSLDEPARILDRVFFTPKDFQAGSLYSFPG